MQEKQRAHLKELPLKIFHEESGARFAEFAGYNMPIQYKLGVMKEHLFTRSKAGLFDISHMRLIEIKGKQASAIIDICMPVLADEISCGKCQYSFMLNEKAGIIDDLIINKLADDRFIVVVNAANAEKDYEHILKTISQLPIKETKIELLDRVILALQGPSAEAIMVKIGLEEACQLKFLQIYEAQENWLISRSGYTGEDGFEIALPISDAEPLVKRLVNLMENEELIWVGLAARDSLRLEAALCLHGSDINEQISPVEAGLMWAIPKAIREDGNFIGAPALKKLIEHKPEKIRMGFKTLSKQPIRSGAILHNGFGEEIGYITSGGPSPSLNQSIAMGYINQSAKAEGVKIFARQRSKDVELEITKMPFVAHNYKR